MPHNSREPLKKQDYSSLLPVKKSTSEIGGAARRARWASRKELLAALNQTAVVLITQLPGVLAAVGALSEPALELLVGQVDVFVPRSHSAAGLGIGGIAFVLIQLVS